MAYAALNAGELNKIVTIQRRVETDAAGGGQTIAWTDVGAWHVSVKPGSGREFMAAQQTLPELSHEITGRFRTDVSSKHRLAYVSNGVVRHFPIHVMLDPEERHEQLVCFCSEIAQT